jgi:FkbM family methyltransferase
MRPYFYLGHNWALTQLSTGLPFFVNTDDRGIGPWIILGGTWENFVDDILCAYVRPGMTILDVGANMGYYTVKLGVLIGPTGQLHAFEPNPELVPFLTENISINGLSGTCTPYAVAAGATTGISSLGFDYSNMGGGALDVKPGQRNRSVDVSIHAIDELLPHVEKADLIKIDAEGYEPLVLKGAARLIQRSPDCAFLLEVFLDCWIRHGKIMEQLEPLANGKRIFAVPHSGRLIELKSEEVQSYLETDSRRMSYFFVCPPVAVDRVQPFVSTPQPLDTSSKSGDAGKKRSRKRSSDYIRTISLKQSLRRLVGRRPFTKLSSR